MIVEGQATLTGTGSLSPAANIIANGILNLSGVGLLTASGLVPWTNIKIADIILELSDREIYNDVRSQTNVTEETEVVTDEAEYRDAESFWRMELKPGETEEIALCTDVERYYRSLDKLDIKTIPDNVTWLKQWIENSRPYNIHGLSEAACYAQGGNKWWPPYSGVSSTCAFPDNTSSIRLTVIKRASWYIRLKITNNHALQSGFTVCATYRYLYSPEERGTITGQRTYMVRATDAISIAKYGRRVMNLVWPLGQTETQMTSLVNAYLERYKEPVPQIAMKLLGKTDAMVVGILSAHVSDKIWIDNTRLGAEDFFFINAINCEHDVSGLLEASWMLEQIRNAERGSIFILDTSVLDGPDILGW